MSSLLIIRIGLLALAFTWLGFCSFKAAAQRLDEWSRIRTEVKDVSAQQQAFELKIETRLVRLETNLEMISRLVWGIGAAVGAHLLQALVGMIVAARRPPPGPGP